MDRDNGFAKAQREYDNAEQPFCDTDELIEDFIDFLELKAHELHEYADRFRSYD